VVLAMTGAPVRAAHLQLTALAVGATLHIHDSLQAGRSRFFAEISRIRAIVDLAATRPQPLFLLDELFQGTNSHDRKIGAEALLAHQAGRANSATHDLALTAIAEQSGSHARTCTSRPFAGRNGIRLPQRPTRDAQQRAA
jgi:DNA mismatch repair ATPase MutS